ncbi:MAG: TRAP transporter substrate-binding protein DctP [Dehalococcoidales bacterium]|nr:TRAP transporter substrate-binding protein DctP [Dehalococcoidales bacterium]
MKKLILFPLVAILIVSLFLCSCSSDTTSKTTQAQTTQAQPTPAKTAPAAAAPIELSLSHSFPPMSGLGVTLQNWADSIAEQTDGRVKITVYGGGSLLKSSELYDGVATGVVDLGYGHPTDDMGRFGLDTAFALPGLGINANWPDVKVKTEVAKKVRDKFPQVKDKQPDVVHLFDCWMSPYVFQCTKKGVTVPDDLKGMKVAASGLFISFATTLGAVPVEVPAPDRYTSLERGLIDGSWDVWGGIFAMKHYEVSKYYTEKIDFGAGSAMVIMSKSKLESLPSDIQQIFLNQQNVALDFPEPAFGKEIPLAKAEVDKRNGVYVDVTPQDIEMWEKAIEPYYDVWVEDMEARGWSDAQAYLNELRQALDSYK